MNQTLFDQINAFARATPWLHGVITVYAAYGVVVFALLLGAGWWSARCSGEPRRMAAVVCAGAATLLAVGLNQPIVNAVHEARPYTNHPGVLVLATRSADFSFPSDHAVMAGAGAVGLVPGAGRGIGGLSRRSPAGRLRCGHPRGERQRRAPAAHVRAARAGKEGRLSMSGLMERLLAVQGPMLYALVAAVVFVEDALFVGFVMPGETTAVLGGVAAGLGHASLPG